MIIESESNKRMTLQIVFEKIIISNCRTNCADRENYLIGVIIVSRLNAATCRIELCAKIATQRNDQQQERYEEFSLLGNQCKIANLARMQLRKEHGNRN